MRFARAMGMAVAMTRTGLWLMAPRRAHAQAPRPAELVTFGLDLWGPVCAHLPCMQDGPSQGVGLRRSARVSVGGGDRLAGAR
jgi:hypothetical protein